MLPDSDLLTPRQRSVYEFIRDQIHGRGYGPTVREIGIQFGINSPNGVMCHLKALQKKGFIARHHNQARAISLVSDDDPDAIYTSTLKTLRSLARREGRRLADVLDDAVRFYRERN